ncbi:hypothetical protein ACIGB8_28715 [Promicromonospora sukumoe]|uniref:hypothetical protein n=1 Tax=Promicromonospora sukumoe TaxID=88382 RepID=UPI0037C85651
MTTTTTAAPALAYDWALLESPFAAHRYTGSAHLLRRQVPELQHVTAGVFHVPATGRPDVVVTAVHATNHHRDGRPKMADRGTGALAVWLAARTGAAALVVLDAAGDANHDRTHPVKTALAGLVDVAHVLDLHGAAVGPVLDLGPGTGPTPPGLVEHLTASALPVTIAARHAARHPHRMTPWAQRRGLHAVQLEIARTHRAPLGTQADVDHLADHLAQAITNTH